MITWDASRITLIGSLYAALVGVVVAHRPWYQAWMRCPLVGALAIPKGACMLALILSGLCWEPALPTTMFFVGAVMFGPDGPFNRRRRA